MLYIIYILKAFANENACNFRSEEIEMNGFECVWLEYVLFSAFRNVLSAEL